MGGDVAGHLRHALSFTITLVLVFYVISAGAAFASPVSVLLTGDGEGYVAPCGECPGPETLGGLARRTPAVVQPRKTEAHLLIYWPRSQSTSCLPPIFSYS